MVTLYHGTKARFAKKILSEGFRRAAVSSYTGTGINMSERMCVSYEYGPYEYRGCVLRCELEEQATIQDIGFKTVSDRYFYENPGIDAVTSYGGNVWVVWNPAVIRQVTRVSKREALQVLHNEFLEDGANHAYNGAVQDHCEAFWGKQYHLVREDCQL